MYENTGRKYVRQTVGSRWVGSKINTKVLIAQFSHALFMFGDALCKPQKRVGGHKMGWSGNRKHTYFFLSGKNKIIKATVTVFSCLTIAETLYND